MKEKVIPTLNYTEIATQLEELYAKFKELEKREQRQVLQGNFVKKLIEKKIPASFARGRIIESEDQIATMLTETEAEYKATLGK